MIGRVIIVATLCCVLAPTLRAELTAFWRHNPITPEAIADDPPLAGMQSWSVMVMLDGHWLFASVRLTLPGGSTFYRNPDGGPHRPSAADVAAHPALAFHTYVTSPHHIYLGHPTPTVLAGFPEPPISFGGMNDPLPGILSLSWGHPETVMYPTPPGTYEILRVTFPLGVLPSSHPENHTGHVTAGADGTDSQHSRGVDRLSHVGHRILHAWQRATWSARISTSESPRGSAIRALRIS